MSDLRQLAESIIGAADFNDPDDALCDEQKAARDIAKECRPLAAFARDMTDETPVDAEWIAGITVTGENIPVCFIWRADTGVWFCKRELVQHLKKCTRGRVRLFALAMGLTLREDGR